MSEIEKILDIKFFICKNIYLLELLPTLNRDITYMLNDSKYNFKFTAPETLYGFESIINKCVEMKQMNIPVDKWLYILETHNCFH